MSMFTKIWRALRREEGMSPSEYLLLMGVFASIIVFLMS